MSTARHRKGAVVLALVLVLTGLLGVLGWSAALEYGESLRVAEDSHAVRLRDMAADSALEEACCVLENNLPHVGALAPGQQRDLAKSLTWPGKAAATLTSTYRIRPTATQASFDALPVSIPEPVEVRSSPWIVTRGDGPGNDSVLPFDVGILELKVPVRVHTGRTTREWKVVARRFISTERTEGTGEARLRIAPQNLSREVIAR
jgi:hypothetical protein